VHEHNGKDPREDEHWNTDDERKHKAELSTVTTSKGSGGEMNDEAHAEQGEEQVEVGENLGVDEARGVLRPGQGTDVVVGDDAGEGEARVQEEEFEAFGLEDNDEGDSGEEELGKDDDYEPGEEGDPGGIEELGDISAVVVVLDIVILIRHEEVVLTKVEVGLLGLVVEGVVAGSRHLGDEGTGVVEEDLSRRVESHNDAVA